MSDLIERQAAIDAINALHESPNAWLDYAVDAIMALPSAQPDIIRCKDCKWSDWYYSDDGNIYYYCMETGASGRIADDYCSYAERRTDELGDS